MSIESLPAYTPAVPSDPNAPQMPGAVDIMHDAPWAFGEGGAHPPEGADGAAGFAIWWKANRDALVSAEVTRRGGNLSDQETQNIGLLTLGRLVTQNHADDMAIARAEAVHVRRQARAERREQIAESLTTAGAVAVGGLRRAARWMRTRHVAAKHAVRDVTKVAAARLS